MTQSRRQVSLRDFARTSTNVGHLEDQLVNARAYATVLGETRNSNFSNNSLATRSSPQPGFSRAIRRMRLANFRRELRPVWPGFASLEQTKLGTAPAGEPTTTKASRQIEPSRQGCESNPIGRRWSSRQLAAFAVHHELLSEE